MKRVFLKGVLEGIVGSVVIDCAVAVLFLTNGTSISPVLIGLLGAIISAIIYTLLAQSNTNNTDVICFSLIGLFSFILFYIGILAIRTSNPLGFFALREGNNADSIILLLCIGCFVVASTALKLCALIIVFIRNIHQGRSSKTGDGLREP